MIVVHLKVGNLDTPTDTYNTFLEELEATIGKVFHEELANVEIFSEEFTSTGPIDVNDTPMYLFIDASADHFDNNPLYTPKAIARARCEQLQEELKGLQESHQLDFSSRIWVRILEGFYTNA